MKIAVFVHHERPDATTVAVTLAEAMAEDGVDVVLPPDDARIAGLGHLGVGESVLRTDPPGLAVAVGGDGTMLRTAQLVGQRVPILGVNVGNLGYLTEVDPPDAVAAVRRVLRGDFGIEERMLVRVAVHRGGGGDGEVVAHALNEAVLEKCAMGHTVRLAVSFDGDLFTTYEADGLIVATPTGSTAYSFSARGPILDPDLRAMVLTPVSPHMLFDRSMVLSPDVEIRLEIAGHRPASLSIDGRHMGELAEGEAVVCTGEGAVHLVSFAPRDFHRILRTKFGLPDR